jgi:triphosphoribosyl-dephospho-CoA synthase
MNSNFSPQLGNWIYQACLVEVLSEKPGNVSPGKSFQNADAADFLKSARVSAPWLAQAGTLGVGRAIYEAARVTRDAVGHNTNLGILLLLAPMAAVPLEVPLFDGLPTILRSLTVADADWTYKAIRVAEPGGLGDSDTQDVREPPTETLRECMCHAAERDLIAQQYTTDFHDILHRGLELFGESATAVPEAQRIGFVALKLMSIFGDSLVARKCGFAVSEDLKQRADTVLVAGWPHTNSGRRAWSEFDGWLRSDGNRLNPGTTADMIAAIVFAALRSAQYTVPPQLS